MSESESTNGKPRMVAIDLETTTTTDPPDDLTTGEQASILKDRFAASKEYNQLKPSEKLIVKDLEIKNGLEDQIKRLEKLLVDETGNCTTLILTVNAQKEELKGYEALKVSHRHLKCSQWISGFFYSLSPLFAFLSQSEDRLASWVPKPVFVAQFSFWLSFIVLGVGILTQAALYLIFRK
ncbi:hypothetical protein [Gimesia sp.]|uniref:hypothetical protein n=1 Tax=Gimesia sp. TaxID=2024833 RepID=UPI003A93EABD